MVTKWTSSIISRFFSLNIAPAVRSHSAATVRIAALARLYASASKSLSPEELEKKKEEARVRRNEKRRLRYQTYPKEREELKQRFASDLDFRERCAQASRRFWQKIKSQFEEDPEAYKLHRDKSNKRHKEEYLQNAQRRWSIAIRERLKYSESFRNEVVWKFHEPVLYSTKMNYHCATCGHTRFQGLKLWWRRKSEAEKYDCPRCFQADRQASTPVYFPPHFTPLPDRGPAKQPLDHDEKDPDESSTGSST